MNKLEFPNAELPTVYKYSRKQELDIKKDRWLMYPLSYKLAEYAYNYADKNQKQNNRCIYCNSEKTRTSKKYPTLQYCMSCKKVY